MLPLRTLVLVGGIWSLVIGLGGLLYLPSPGHAQAANPCPSLENPEYARIAQRITDGQQSLAERRSRLGELQRRPGSADPIAGERDPSASAGLPSTADEARRLRQRANALAEEERLLADRADEIMAAANNACDNQRQRLCQNLPRQAENLRRLAASKAEEWKTADAEARRLEGQDTTPSTVASTSKSDELRAELNKVRAEISAAEAAMASDGALLRQTPRRITVCDPPKQ